MTRLASERVLSTDRKGHRRKRTALLDFDVDFDVPIRPAWNSFSIGYRIWCRYLKGGAKRFENVRVGVIIPEDLHLRFLFLSDFRENRSAIRRKKENPQFISFPRRLISPSIIRRIFFFFFPSTAKSTSFLNHLARISFPIDAARCIWYVSL